MVDVATKEELLNELERALNIAFAELFIATADKAAMEQAVRRFVDEEAGQYEKEALLYLFDYPDIAISLCLGFLRSKGLAENLKLLLE